MEPVNVVLFAGAVVVTGYGGLLLGRHMAARSLNFRVTTSPKMLKVCGQLKVSVEMCPRDTVQVDQIEIVVRCVETVYVSERDWTVGLIRWLYSRRSSDTERQVLCEERSVFPQGRKFLAGAPETLDFELVLPDGVGTQRHADARSIDWSVTVQFAIPSAPDAIVTIPLQVAPRYA